MSKVRIYTTTFCPYCIAAKALLDQKGVAYEEINLTHNPDEKQKVMGELRWRTVPIILIGDALVGGFDELAGLEREKKLDAMLP